MYFVYSVRVFTHCYTKWKETVSKSKSRERWMFWATKTPNRRDEEKNNFQEKKPHRQQVNEVYFLVLVNFHFVSLSECSFSPFSFYNKSCSFGETFSLIFCSLFIQFGKLWYKQQNNTLLNHNKIHAHTHTSVCSLARAKFEVNKRSF